MGATSLEQPRQRDYASVVRWASAAAAIKFDYAGVARLASGRRGRGVRASGEAGGSRSVSGRKC